MTLSHQNHATTSCQLDPAALADTAYQALLRHGLGMNWLDIQLELWQAMIEKIQHLERVSGKSARVPQVYPKLEPMLA